MRADGCKEKSDGVNGVIISQTLPDTNTMNRHPVGSLQERCTNNASVPFLFRDFNSRFSSLLKSPQSQFYVLLLVAIAVVLLLMQVNPICLVTLLYILSRATLPIFAIQHIPNLVTEEGCGRLNANVKTLRGTTLT